MVEKIIPEDGSVGITRDMAIFGTRYDDGDVMILENMDGSMIDHEMRAELDHRRFSLNELVFCIEGEMHCALKNSVYCLIKNSVLMIPSYCMLERCKISSDAKILIICFSTRISKFFTPLWNRAVYQNRYNHVVMSDSDIEGINCIWEVIKNKFKQKIDKYERKIIYMNLGIIFCKVLRYIEYHENAPIRQVSGKSSYRGNLLFEKFLDILATSVPKRHSVKYYADQLSITPNYLSVICSKCSNKSVKEWIQESVQEEVRIALMQFNLSIKEVAEDTGFSNLSFFTRYVKKCFGCTPTEYRRRYK